LQLCVLIPTWKRLPKLKIALRSLERQSSLPDRVVVISRDIDQEVNQWLEKAQFTYPLSHYIIDRPGVIAAENLGLSHIEEDIVAFLDDDAEAPPDWIRRIKETLTQEDVVAVGGPDYIVYEKEDDYPRFCESVGQLTYYGKVMGNHHQNSSGIHEVSVLKGVNMAFKRDLIPYLDENLATEHHLGNGSQWELDLCLSVKPKGKILFLSDLRVNHYSNHSHFNILENQKNNAHNIVYVLLKHFGILRKFVFLNYLFFVGNQQNIGLVKALSLCPKIGAKLSFQLFKSSCIGAFFGLKTYRRWKKYGQ
jgi:glycosyltransferase involved in cell wall biosynthesis